MERLTRRPKFGTIPYRPSPSTHPARFILDGKQGDGSTEAANRD
jgi:hypothetical protein